MMENIEVLYGHDTITGPSPTAWEKVEKAIIKLNEVIDEMNKLRIEVETLKRLL